MADSPARGEARPLSVGQQAMWFLQRLAPGSTAYTMMVAVRVRGPLDVGRLRRATAAVVARHELLRSVFTEVGGVPHRLAADLPVPLSVRDVGAVGDDVLRDLVREAGREPFDLEGTGAFRVTLVRRDARDAVLMLVSHHIVSDAMSQWLVLRDLLWAYDEGDAPGWPPLGRTFDDYVRGEAELLASPRRERLERYWRGVCEGAVPGRLPADRPRPGTPSLRGAATAVSFSRETGARLVGSARELGVSPFAPLVAALQAVLYRYAGGGDFLIGCPASTRFTGGMRNVAGYFANTLPIRASLTPATTFGAAAVAAQRAMVGGVAHAALPSALIGELTPGRAPLFHVAINLLPMEAMDPPLPLAADGSVEGPETTHRGLRLAAYDVPQMEGQFDLMVDVRKAGDVFTAVVKHDTDLFEPATVRRFAGHFRRAVETGVPDLPVGRFPLVDDDEVRRLLALGSA
ncbi:peptide synthetase [Nonomuraea sp. FMUSA5-5]|uniref:Peptide synthetase n=1 Tax=Nonomuraea composti TaxID=2720023 RepID=A0ABX1BF34_9ACTN|nr:condensation domain-containing protein [Nonomuraea sp. FMUSA5-5]NJP96360.1 peptide synthetase [Nonomuraea sp. FMUSA5-5]